jgi:hypothetical protein
MGMERGRFLHQEWSFLSFFDFSKGNFPFFSLFLPSFFGREHMRKSHLKLLRAGKLRNLYSYAKLKHRTSLELLPHRCQNHSEKFQWNSSRLARKSED